MFTGGGLCEDFYPAVRQLAGLSMPGRITKVGICSLGVRVDGKGLGFRGLGLKVEGLGFRVYD